MWKRENAFSPNSNSIANCTSNNKNCITKHVCTHSSSCKICSAVKSLSPDILHNKIKIHEIVKNSGKFNFQSCRIRVNSKINTDFMRSMLSDYKDKLVCDLLEFGFPLNFKGDENDIPVHSEIWKCKNHKGASDYPNEIIQYLQKESEQLAILGPFKTNPFSGKLIISPLNSVPKKDPSERRVILDLSFPKTKAVNDHIDKSEYLGETIDLVFPKVDDFVELIKIKGKGCLLFKKDLKRAYRQISICPSNYNLVSYVWRKHIFCDTVLTMGLRNAAAICQRVTTAVVFIMFKIGIFILNYLDDLAGAETKEKAFFAYSCLGSILKKCGLEEAPEKACEPTEIMVFLGVLFNTKTMTMEVTEERLLEIRSLLQSWLCYSSASVKQIQSLLGKLNFVAACVKPSRIFISRLLQWLRSINKSSASKHVIPEYVRKDLLWWHKFLPLYNGISMMSYEEWSSPDEIFSSDSCLEGCGGFWKGAYFHSVFPENILNQNLHITALEVLSIILCLRLWGQFFKGLRIVVFCDNMAACQIINSGKSRCQILQDFLREICFLAAKFEFQIRATHLESSSNRIADHLSRWHQGPQHKLSFLELTRDFTLQKYVINDSQFKLIHDW